MTRRTALVTGGARGQGREIALRLAREGADIVLVDRASDLESVPYPLASPTDLERTAADVRALGRICVQVEADVRDRAAMQAVVAGGIRDLGGVDLVVCAAGVISYGFHWELSEAEWTTIIGVNLTGAWIVASAIAPHWIERGDGCFIAVASVASVEGGPGYAHYAASKHALVGLVRAVALELGRHGVRANAVLPGPIDTVVNDNPVARDRIAGRRDATRAEYLRATRNWHLLGRDALPASAVASAVAWLASDEARNVTGALVPVDAGHLVLPGRGLQPP
jgi:NAD(P)-dependent dehydrogenase (short-subunit alcohol dehydrogenase family)